MMDKTFAGVDVSKDCLDVAIAGDGHIARIANTPAGIAAWLDRVRPALVAFEPTGGWERSLQRALRERTIPFARVHPNEVVAFRRSRGLRAKTDRIDAALLAGFAAEELTRRERPIPVDGDDELRDLAARRRQLVDTLHAERCRREVAHSEAVRASIDTLIGTLARSLRAIEAEIARRIARDHDLAALEDLLRTLKGVGPVTAATLIADLPEIGRLSGKQIAALVGLAPQTRQSGKTARRATTGHGRPGVRRVLFNAARSAIRHNAAMAAFYQRLVTQNQRPGKVALLAVMRKMLVTLNAIARDRQPWKAAHIHG